MRILVSIYKPRVLMLLAALLSMPLHAHHWFQESHDIDTLLTVEVQVIEFRFINPHPFFSARVTDDNKQQLSQYGDVDSEWQLQMDNRWELAELGFDAQTLSPGDKVVISAHPGSFSKNIFYVKALEHPRLGFRYEHNVRQLLELQKNP